MNKVTVDDLVRVGPDTLGGRYLRTFWTPVYRSEDLEAGTSTPIRILGEDFTLYRGDSGKAYIVAPRCAHRLTRLHTGQIHGDKIACLYHGWQYDGTGQCTFQPGEDERFTRNTKIAAYPTEEYLGLIWGYFGEGEAPPMRRLPDFERPGLLTTALPEYWPCNFFNRIDNAPDGMHVLFTHQESTKRDAKVVSQMSFDQLPAMQSVETGFGVETEIRFGAKASYFQFIMPFTNILSATVGRLEGPPEAPRAWRAEAHFRVPVDDDHFVSFGIVLIDLHGEEANAYLQIRNTERAKMSDSAGVADAYGQDVLAGQLRIADLDASLGTRYTFQVEDYVAMVGQSAIPDRKQERLGRADQGTALIRRVWMREMQALADGQPMKKWEIPAGLVDKTQPQPSFAKVRKSEEVVTQG